MSEKGHFNRKSPIQDKYKTTLANTLAKLATPLKIRDG